MNAVSLKLAHYGPDFGSVGLTGFVGEQPTAWIEEQRDLTEDRLRRLASDALAAADWLARLTAEHVQGTSGP